MPLSSLPPLARAASFRGLPLPVNATLFGPGGNASGASTGARLWQPVPPAGYASLGCVVTHGSEAPNVGSVACVRGDLVTVAPLQRCLMRLRGEDGSMGEVWQVGNRFRTAVLVMAGEPTMGFDLWLE